MATIHQLNPSTNAKEVDKIFFAKADLRVGSSLRYYGRRTERGQLFFVQNVESRRTQDARFVDHVQSPRTLTDKVVLRDARNGRLRVRTFSYLSYSAIWRLED